MFILITFAATTAQGETCLSPPRPFLPAGEAEMIEFAEIIRQDFEYYINDIQAYFRCLDEERARAFEEARQVSQDYGRFQAVIKAN
ncbi:hypothetical protein [uncultured Sulfitobacter sp.]|nr:MULTISPECIES: hypothetical protein [Roseobacteraceae]